MITPELVTASSPIVALLEAGTWTTVVGWASVDIDRAAAELAVAGAGGARDLDEPILGARVRAVRSLAPPILLLEPVTEGRLAATLARFGEGPHVLYIHLAPTKFEAFRGRAAGADLRLSPVTAGAFGRTVLVASPRPWGPHVLVTDGPAAGTIGP